MPALRRSVVAFVLACWAWAGAALPAQNSTRKERPEPSARAARCGSAVPWFESLDAALREAAEADRPVFWYVPTLPGSPMDRKAELDFYMRAGPFSWPGTIALLERFFVPLRAVPDRAQAERYDLRPLRFVEPGWLVLDADGDERARLDEITTLVPQWFDARLIATLPAARRRRAAQVAQWDFVLPGDFFGSGPGSAGMRFDTGRRRYAAGDHAAAKKTWRALIRSHPEHPLAWKAQAELEGHGPFVRGFEVDVRLPDAVLSGPGVRGSRAPADVYDEPSLRAAAVAFLDRMQGPAGGFTDSRYDFGGTDSLPNVHVAITAVAAWSLLEMLAREPEGAWRERAEKTLEAALAYATDDARLNPADRDELIWAHLYRCRLLARWLELRPDDGARLLPRLRAAVAAIAGMQGEGGAWYHEYPNPFVSGSCLVALAAARRHGVGVPEAVVERGLRALLACRAESGAVSYGQVRRGPPRARVAGGAGRMPLVEHALTVWGQGDSGALERAIAASFEHHDALAAVRKYDDHASPHGYGGFFFWYDVQVRLEAIRALPDAPQRSEWLGAQRAQILALPEIDGCFVDSHELGRVYGTALAMICLARCAP